MRHFFALCFIISAVLIAQAALAAKPFTEDQVPGSLKPWMPWVMHDVETDTCPYYFDRMGDHACIWPTRLSLSIGAKSGSFSYQVTVYDNPERKPQRILLPGTHETWPQEVKIDKHAAPVLAFENHPSILLTQGTYTISGSFYWDTIPVSLRIPATMGLIQLSVEGHDVAIPDIEGDQLWIRRGAQAGTETAEENRLDAKVFRKVTDGVPLFMDTYIRLQVSGKQREETLGKILPEGVIPVSVESDLPARLDDDGTLRMQLRPGSWGLHINARYPDAVTKLSLPAKGGILPEQEIWSFEPMNSIRLVQVEGVEAIDPSQTELPNEWRAFPAYLMKPKSVFTLNEKKRGATETVPDELNLSREIWLDFSGHGYTFEDTITGAIHQSSRLEAGDGMKLGDASINNRNQYITRIGEKGAPGVEVREGPIYMRAGSRIESGSPQFSVTGWKSKFDHVDAQLFLPPGWSLFTYSGVDSVSSSWVSNWSLLDLFLVLLAAVAVYKLYDLRAGLLALVALVLMQHALGGFTNLILLVLATVALLRYLPQGYLHTAITWGQRFLFLLVLVSVLPFMVEHIRQAIYPQLNPSWATQFVSNNLQAAQSLGGGATGGGQLASAGNERRQYGYRGYARHKERVMAEGQYDEEKSREVGGVAGEMSISPGSLPASPSDMAAAPAPPLPPPPPAMLSAPGYNMNADALKKTGRMRSRMAAASKAISSFAPEPSQQIALENYQQYAPDTKVQTGYGNATWRNNAISLSWSGIVDPTVDLKLYLISANGNLTIALMRVLLSAALIALLIKPHVARLKDGLFTRGAALVLLAMALSLAQEHQAMAAPRQVAAQQDATGDLNLVYPPQYLLDDMKEKLETTLNEPPACSPLCATVAHTHFNAEGNMLEITQEVHAGANVALPLPGGQNNWRPSEVTVDGAPATAFMGDYLVVNLSSGVHQVRMVGALPNTRDSIGISLPVPPHFTDAQGKGWDVQGIHENGLADNSIQLVRTTKSAVKSEEKTLERTAIAPFFTLERTFVLAQQWQMHTTVRRITPDDEPAAVRIPLLPDETITTAGIQIKDNGAYANFDPGNSEVSWDSVITPSAALKLTAAKTKPWVETWRLTVSNLWHASVTGIPRVFLSDAQSAGMNAIGNPVNFWQWQPWPGESVTVDISRPQGVEGDTRTLDASELAITPGKRSMEMALTLKLRSSLGGQHEVTLPEGAILLEVKQGGMTLPIQLKGDILSLPLVPGDNVFSIRWKQDEALPFSFHVPAIGNGLERSVNSETTIDLPDDRWLLFAHGPQVGPAVLFWSWLPVILLASWVLGRLKVTPLRMRHWFLLLLGLNQATVFADIIVIAWLLALGLRGKRPEATRSGIGFNIVQVLLVILTILSFNLLFASISAGLLGSPDMHVVGDDSIGNHLHWYQDITGATLSQPLVISVSIWVYRVLMLLWALWLAFAVVGWLRWGWACFAKDGYWSRMEWDRAPHSPAPPAG